MGSDARYLIRFLNAGSLLFVTGVWACPFLISPTHILSCIYTTLTWEATGQCLPAVGGTQKMGGVTLARVQRGQGPPLISVVRARLQAVQPS